MRKIIAILYALIMGGLSIASVYGVQSVEATRIAN
jgi:hypothetical protein